MIFCFHRATVLHLATLKLSRIQPRGKGALAASNVTTTTHPCTERPPHFLTQPSDMQHLRFRRLAHAPAPKHIKPNMTRIQ